MRNKLKRGLFCLLNFKETNIKIQTKIDRLFVIIEENGKQLAESNAMQVQLAQRLDENQRTLSEFRNKCQEVEFEYEEKLGDMQKRLTNHESLSETYQSDMQKYKQQIGQLEQCLSEKALELSNAMSEIVNEKNEVSNLETVRKDLEAQRSLITRDLQDSEIKGK
jgi:chromosome segregation ATPase